MLGGDPELNVREAVGYYIVLIDDGACASRGGDVVSDVCFHVSFLRKEPDRWPDH